MGYEGTLEGIYVGADVEVVMRVWANQLKTIPQNITEWTIILDIRPTDLSPTALLSKTGVVTGVFNSDPSLNTQIVTFTISDLETAATIFKGDDVSRRFSIKRTDEGFEHPLFYGDAPIVRVTQI